MDWYEISAKAHELTFPHDGRLSVLPTEWERELAALWRLEADVNNGAYLQFLCNWGRESYMYASQSLEKIGAMRMAQIIDQCQSLIDEHWSGNSLPYNEVLNSLPTHVAERIMELSYEFMEYPDDIEELGMCHYMPFLTTRGSTQDMGG